jgi:hypothetical protein
MTDQSNPKVVSPYKEITTAKQYYASFKECKLALAQVLDIRKFEIELYWKRATYNWAFVAAILAGYFTVSSSMTSVSSPTELLKLQYLLECLGLVFSVAWYFVNRGSKYWQANWERHLDLLEEKVYGPLYRTNAKKSYFRARFFHLLGPFPFSPTKINHLLGVFMIFIWIALVIEYAVKHFTLHLNSDSVFYFVVTLVSSIALLSLAKWGKTGKKRTDDNYTVVDFERRGIKNK